MILAIVTDGFQNSCRVTITCVYSDCADRLVSEQDHTVVFCSIRTRGRHVTLLYEFMVLHNGPLVAPCTDFSITNSQRGSYCDYLSCLCNVVSQ